MNRYPLLLLGMTALAPFASHAARPTGTIKDLEAREVRVEAQAPGPVQQQQAIEQYRRFLELEARNAALRAEATRRLGDLQVEVDETNRAAGAAALSSAELADAVRLYEELLTAAPDYALRDAVMYQLARAYEAQGRTDRALNALGRLVEETPQSAWRTESEFRRGEILFSLGRYREAQSAYAAVVTSGADTGFFEQGLYKLGWTFFKQSDGERTIDTFLRLLDRLLVKHGNMKDRDALSRPERELTDDALRALAITFSDLDGAQTLDATLQARGAPPYAYLLYTALGDLYIEKQRYQDAALAFEAFARQRPDDRRAPSLQMRSIDAYHRGGFASLVLQGKQAFVERYAFGAAFWSSRTQSEAPEVAAQLQANLRDLAEFHHAQAQKTRKAEHYTAAARWYRALLDSFPDDDRAPATRYLLAETLFESGRNAEAAREYERTAYDYAAHDKAATAGYAALIAYEKHEAQLSGESRALWHRQGVESALMFATSFPDHPESARVLTRADEKLFALNEFDRVIEVSQQLLERRPSVDLSYQRTAATLLSHALFDRERYAEAEQAYVRVQTFLSAQDADRPAIEERIAASIYKQAEARQRAGDEHGAVADFLRVGARAPNAKVRASAEFDAASILIRNKDWPRAIEVLEAFRRVHREHALSHEVTRALAAAYLESGRGLDAATEFERIAARPQEAPDVRRAALWQSAELFERAGSPVQAARIYAAYIEQFPSPLDPAMDARRKLAELARADRDHQARMRWNTEMIRADREAGVARTARSRYLAAKAMLEGAEPQTAVFNAVRLVAPLDKTLKAKRVAMEKALAVYGQALDYEVAEVTTAATFGMAELYRSLAADLLASERPKNLDAEALEQYDVLLEEQAFPFEEKAIELHEINARRTAQGLYDPWVQRSLDELARLKPARYAKTEVIDEYAAELQ